MTQEPTLDRGSIWMDLRGIQEGTHPLVLDGREWSLTLDEEAGRFVRAFWFEGDILFDGRDYRVRGSLEGTLETACDRCLTPFESALSSEVEFRAIPQDSRPDGGDPFEEGVMHLDGHRQLDLAVPLRAAAVLEVPIKSVCRADCLGICPTCGANRNLEPCDCQPGTLDPRWEALRGLSYPTDPKE